MKKLILFTLLGLGSMAGFSQAPDLRKKIEVNGSAEAEVTPDIIYFSITLREYFADNGLKKKIGIEELEQQLQTAVMNAGIPRENFTINNIFGYNYPLEKKKDPGFLARKQYSIKITDLSRLNQIMAAVDAKGIESTGIDKYDYSQLESLKRELKVKAIVSAKDKATYLAKAIGETVMGAIEIQEINNDYQLPQPMYRANAMMAMKSDALAEVMPDIDFKKIKLSYQMRVVFELR